MESFLAITHELQKKFSMLLACHLISINARFLTAGIAVHEHIR